MFGFLGGALKGLGLGFAKAGIQSFWNRRAAAEDFERNANLSWEMWNANNAYNHPAAQMQRFRAADLNPNLIYGNMAQAPMPAMVKSTTSPSDFEWNLNVANQLENSALNNELVANEIKNKIQQRHINDVAMANTEAATNLAKQRLKIEARQADDAHKESGLRREAMSLTIGDTAGVQDFWDKLYDKITGSDGRDKRGRGAPLQHSVSFGADLLKKIGTALLSRKKIVTARWPRR